MVMAGKWHLKKTFMLYRHALRCFKKIMVIDSILHDNVDSLKIYIGLALNIGIVWQSQKIFLFLHNIRIYNTPWFHFIAKKNNNIFIFAIKFKLPMNLFTITLQHYLKRRHCKTVIIIDQLINVSISLFIALDIETLNY